MTDDTVISSPTALTPWEMRGGLWYKREDYHRNAYGVNGAKYRACRHLMSRAIADGAEHIVSAQSVMSPQAAIAATLAAEFDIPCTLVVGASRPETAIKHVSIRIAVDAGAALDTSMRVAYNPVIQPYGARLAAELDGWQVPYGITTPAGASEEELEDFLAVGGAQVANLPPELETLVVPFGSGNTAAGVLYGLATLGTGDLKRVVLVGIGPDREAWLRDRLKRVGVFIGTLGLDIIFTPLHDWFATYADRMPETLDDIVMHPTYEGKVVRYLNSARPSWWTARDGSAGLWIVGGPIG